MDARKHLRGLGWGGEGHSLGKHANGIKKPLLISHKTSLHGIGAKTQKQNQADQWWLNAFDNALKDIGTGKESALSKVRENGGKGSLYGFFVRGVGLEGTISLSSTGTNTPAESCEGTTSEPRPEKSKSKKEKKLKKDKKRKREEDPVDSHQDEPEPMKSKTPSASNSEAEKSTRTKRSKKKQSRHSTPALEESVAQNEVQPYGSAKTEVPTSNVHKKGTKEERRKLREEKRARKEARRKRREEAQAVT